MARYRGQRYSTWVKTILWLFMAGIVAFSALLGAVISGGHDQVSGDPKIMVILGCQVKPWGPSVLLQDRLDRALAYLEDHPDVTVVTSGGQGPDEPTTEAQAMYDYLVASGVAAERILKEESSHNTWQNLNETFDLLKQSGYGDQLGQILVVSNDFHLARVRMLFGRVWEGTYTLSTLAAPTSHMPSRLKMYVREPVALVKSFVFDR
ncbi:MAG: YdcF family protein [Lawsonibacter sp.]|nr:YdcF family protein [Lawsonibacter sp.]